MRKNFFLLICFSLLSYFVNAQDKKYQLENSWGGTVFKSIYDVPSGFGVEHGDTAISVNFYFNQLFVIPIKKRMSVHTGIGLNRYLAGIRNGRTVLKMLKQIPPVTYTPTRKDTVSTIIKARYKNLYIAVPLSFRYVLPIDGTLSIYAELGIENEFLVVSKTALALKEGNWYLFGSKNVKRSTQSDGPVVDFYDEQVNRYAANVFGIVGLEVKVTTGGSFALTLGYQRSIVERNQLLVETTGISLGFKYQYFITR